MKRSIALLIAAVIGLVYGIYIISYFVGTTANSSSGIEMVAVGIATALVLPHITCVLVALIFNIVGWAINKRGFALTAGILYSVAAVVFISYAFFVVPSIVLSFVGYAKLKKIIEFNKNKQGEIEKTTE
jgi:hypothetical protein